MGRAPSDSVARSRVRESSVEPMRALRGEEHETAVSLMKVAGETPDRSNTQARFGVGARLVPRTITWVSPAMGAQVGETEATTGGLEASYTMRRGGTCRGWVIGSGPTWIPPSVVAESWIAPRGSSWGAAQWTS
jgi:hypothetical protein